MVGRVRIGPGIRIRTLTSAALVTATPLTDRVSVRTLIIIGIAGLALTATALIGGIGVGALIGVGAIASAAIGAAATMADSVGIMALILIG